MERPEPLPGSLEAATRIAPAGETGLAFSGEVPDGWQQGRGAFGGLVLAMLTRAAASPPAAAGRPLRSLSAQLVGPVRPGPVALEVEVLRAGTGVTTVAARALQGGQVQAHAVSVFGKRRPGGEDWVDLDAPDAPPFDETPVALLEPPFAPVFARHFEFRPTGRLPFTGGPPRATGWVRPRVAPSAWNAPLVAAVADAYWPAAFGRFEFPRPIATVAFTLELLCDPGVLVPEAPFFHAAHAVASEGGFVVELRELRDPSGRLVAMNQQTIAILG